MDNGEERNICLLDKRNIYNNRPLQVINQYDENDGTHKTRYDVTILVNGLPLVHVELKRKGIRIQEAFNQINRYYRELFWTGSGIYDYAQIFITSNCSETKYEAIPPRFISQCDRKVIAGKFSSILGKVNRQKAPSLELIKFEEGLILFC